MLETDVAVVGAGPAGLAAAIAAAESGARVTIVDEYPSPGGQFYKQLPADYRVADRTLLDHDYTKGDELIRRAGHPNVELLSDTLVWGAFEPGVLDLARSGAALKLKAGVIVVATGAYDRPVAFPGWDLPGVITAGAAQSLAKAESVLPGRRVLIAGSGPFLLPVAHELALRGAEVVAVAEATRRREWARAGRRMLRHPARLRDYVAYRARLRRMPFLWGHVIVRADGDGRVESVTLARADGAWRPRAGPERTFAVDAVATAYGFLPSIELARALGCALDGEAVV